MATQATVRDQGLTVLYEAPHPKIDIVFVHGFTGHPKNTWTWKRVKHGSADQKRKRGPVGEPPIDRGIKWPFGNPRRNTATAASSSSPPDRDETGRTANSSSSSSNANEQEGQKEEVYWPAELACQTIPDSRILTYGYDTNIRHWSKGPISKKTVYDHARDLLYSLEERRCGKGEASRPLLFVAHSLGGIIVKEALRQSHQYSSTKPQYDITQATKGLVFFGTPHRGADPRNSFHQFLTASAQFLGFKANPQIVETLMPDSLPLRNLSDEFTALCYDRQWAVYSFQEEYGVKQLMGTKVVDDHSSCLGILKIEVKRHIANNHMDMCRFSGLQDPEYCKVASALRFIAERVGKETYAQQSFGSEQSYRTSVPNGDFQHGVVSLAQDQRQRVSWLPESQDYRGGSFQSEASAFYNLQHGSCLPAESHGCIGRGPASDSIDATTKASLVDKLFFPEIDDRLTNLRPAQGKTCRWFLDKPEYQEWRNLAHQSDDNGFLWIKGNPGTGKSTLMKLLFEEARKDAKGNPLCITLSFFFLARGVLEERSTVGLYRSLLHQLFEKAEDLREGLEWMTASGAKGILENGWSEEALKRTLTESISRLENRFLTIFVDALDECDQNQVAGMVSLFEDLCEHAMASTANLRICFSSRHYPTISINKGAEITLEAEDGHTNDIDQYIKSRLRLGKQKNPDKVAQLRAEIRDKSSGIFLWVVLVVDILNRKHPNTVSIDNMRKSLRQIPPGLNELFEMILGRDCEELDQMHLCLKWILFAVRPLKPSELYFAVQLGLGRDSLGYWDREDVGEDEMKTFVRASSKGLAEVTRNKASEVQFIHESVRDFLLGRYGAQWSGASGDFRGHSHDVLKDCCLAQLRAPIYERFDIPGAPPKDVEAAKSTREALQQKFPFLDYSVSNVLNHANSAQEHGIAQEEALKDFPLPRWATLNNCLEINAVRRYTASVSLIYILAEKNLQHLIHIHPRPTDFLVVGEERYGPPIFAALATDSHDTVEAILQGLQKDLQHLDPPVDLRALYHQKRQQGYKFGRRFEFSKRKHLLSHLPSIYMEVISVAYFLLGHVDVNKTDHRGRTLLFWAAETGHVAVVKQLLDMGHDVNATDPRLKTPLLLAAQNGHETIVKQLLDTGNVDVNATDYNRSTPLLLAVENGHETIVKQLLDTGRVDINLGTSSDKMTPLMQAAANGSDAVVKLLLDSANIDIGVEDKNGRTALHWAAWKGNTSIAKRLLDTRDVKVNAKTTKSGETPLIQATAEGHEAVVKLLLGRADIDVNVGDKNGWTPLHWAVRQGRETIVRYLLSTGDVDVNAKARSGDTPLSMVSVWGSYVMRNLLQEYAERNPGGGSRVNREGGPSSQT